MDRILVEVFYPGMGRRYDFWIPKKMLIQTAIEKISAEISAFENNPLVLEGMETRLLCSQKLGIALNPADSVLSAGLHSGDTLILV